MNADRQFYHCFGCKAGGDVFRFVQETENVGFVEAVELLSRRAGIPIPERRAGEHQEVERAVVAVVLEQPVDLPRPRSSAIRYDPRFLD